MVDPLLALKLLVTLGLAGSIVLARVAPPPPRRPPLAVEGLCLAAVAGCTAGLFGVSGSPVFTALSVEAAAGALWLLRAPRSDNGGGGGGGGSAPLDPGPDPDAPDPAAFDWDAFERAGRTPAGVR